MWRIGVIGAEHGKLGRLLRAELAAVCALCLGLMPLAIAQTPGPPQVPLGQPMKRELGAPGDPRPPLPAFKSQQGAQQLATPSQPDSKVHRGPSAGSGEADTEPAKETLD